MKKLILFLLIIPYTCLSQTYLGKTFPNVVNKNIDTRYDPKTRAIICHPTDTTVQYYLSSPISDTINVGTLITMTEDENIIIEQIMIYHNTSKGIAVDNMNYLRDLGYSVKYIKFKHKRIALIVTNNK